MPTHLISHQAKGARVSRGTGTTFGAFWSILSSGARDTNLALQGQKEHKGQGSEVRLGGQEVGSPGVSPA